MAVESLVSSAAEGFLADAALSATGTFDVDVAVAPMGFCFPIDRLIEIHGCRGRAESVCVTLPDEILSCLCGRSRVRCCS